MKLYPKDQSNPRYCSEYGILEISEGVIIPKNLQTQLDPSQRECYIEPNITYELFIETSKGRIVNSTTIFIPECIYAKSCECPKEENIPIPNIQKISIINNTLEVEWLVHLNEFYSQANLDKLEFYIKNVSNPTLPWGGNKDDIGDIATPLKFFASENNYVAGSSLIPAEHLLIQGVNYEVHSRIIDEEGCVGSSSISAFRVGKESSALFYAEIAIGIVCLLIICMVLFMKYFKKQSSKEDDM